MGIQRPGSGRGFSREVIPVQPARDRGGEQ